MNDLIIRREDVEELSHIIDYVRTTPYGSEYDITGFLDKYPDLKL